MIPAFQYSADTKTVHATLLPGVTVQIVMDHEAIWKELRTHGMAEEMQASIDSKRSDGFVIARESEFRACVYRAGPYVSGMAMLVVPLSYDDPRTQFIVERFLARAFSSEGCS